MVHTTSNVYDFQVLSLNAKKFSHIIFCTAVSLVKRLDDGGDVFPSKTIS